MKNSLNTYYTEKHLKLFSILYYIMNTNSQDLNNDVLNITFDYVKYDKGNKLPLLSESQLLLVEMKNVINLFVCSTG